MEKLEQNLTLHVHVLAKEIGERSIVSYKNLNWAAEYIQRYLSDLGYTVEKQIYQMDGRDYFNLIVEKTGLESPEEIIVVGAHYDTVTGTPGADDNASGVAALLELARLSKQVSFRRTVRFVAFSLEEPPVFGTSHMGSRVNARMSRQKDENIIAMLCLESIGYYTDEKNSQDYPLPFMSLFYPDEGNFVTVVGNFASKDLVDKVADGIKVGSDIPVETLTSPFFVPGVALSDHYSFWKEDYKAVMITDTAMYRNPHYHRTDDTIDTLDFKSLVEVVKGIFNAIENLTAK